MGEKEAMQLLEAQGTIDAHCAFCRIHYGFDKADVYGLFHHTDKGDGSVWH